MSVLLFKLKDVPDDEAEDIRALLADHDIDYYETFAGNWGISMPAIWLKDKQQLRQAKSIIAHYQQQRSIRMRDEYDKLKRAGNRKTMVHRFAKEPLRFLVYFAIIALILYLSVKPFLDFGK